MSRYFNLIVFLATLYCVQSKYIDVELREGRNIKGTGEVEIELKVKRANKTTFATNGIIKVNVPISNLYQMRTLLFKKQGNEYRLTPYHVGMCFLFVTLFLH